MNEQIHTEIWRQIGTSKYAVSNLGTVRNLKTGRLRSNTHRDKDGYIKVSLNQETRKTFSVHRLVLDAFVGPCPLNHEVNHKNGIRSDNRLENLEYVTHKQNMSHSRNVLLTVKVGLPKLKCPQGHPYKDNSFTRIKNGYAYRVCKTCKRNSRNKVVRGEAMAASRDATPRY